MALPLVQMSVHKTKNEEIGGDAERQRENRMEMDEEKKYRDSPRKGERQLSFFF